MSSPGPSQAIEFFLASQSPRRRELLERGALPLRLVKPGPEHEELVPAGASPEERAIRLAREKAFGATVPRGSNGLLLASDTVVALDGRCFSKPRDRGEALAFLRELEDREHEVWTAIALVPVVGGELQREQGTCEAHGARVRFRRFAPGELEAYLATGEWHDKAGGYGIQAAAQAFATLVAGELDTVIGLPTAAVLRHWQCYLDSRR